MNCHKIAFVFACHAVPKKWPMSHLEWDCQYGLQIIANKRHIWTMAWDCHKLLRCDTTKNTHVQNALPKMAQVA
jgi:hypothetical protein